MHVFLLVLKIIGIVLLCIIGFVLFLIALILFVPIRYRLFANKDSDNSPVEGKVNISFLLHIISVWASYDKGLVIRAKLFGIPIWNNRKETKKEETDKSNDSHEDISSSKEEFTSSESDYVIDWNEDEADNLDNDNGNKIISDSADNEEVISEDANDSVSFDDNQKDADSQEDVDAQEDAEGENDSDVDDTKIETENGLKFTEKISIFLKKIFDIVVNIPDNIFDFLDKGEDKLDSLDLKAQKLEKKINYYQKMYNDSRNRKAVTLGITEIKKIIKGLLPKKVKGLIHFGFEDPATNGQILACLGLMAPLLPRKLVIEPDFEEVTFEGNIYIKGRFALIRLLIALFKLYFNKDVRRLYRLYKKKPKK